MDFRCISITQISDLGAVLSILFSLFSIYQLEPSFIFIIVH